MPVETAQIHWASFIPWVPRFQGRSQASIWQRRIDNSSECNLCCKLGLQYNYFSGQLWALVSCLLKLLGVFAFLSFFGSESGHLSLFFAEESWVSTGAWRPLAPLPFIRAFTALLFAEVGFEANSVACSEVLDVSRYAKSAVAGLLVGACWGSPDSPKITQEGRWRATFNLTSLERRDQAKTQFCD